MVIDSGNYDLFQEESWEERDMLLNNDNWDLFEQHRRVER